jgi:hypothetical protein
MKNKHYQLNNKPENFGLLLKGASLGKLPKYKDCFNDCIIVSDYDDELRSVGSYLTGKNITQFTNRTMASSLTRENYIKYNIKHIQLGQVLRWNHFTLMKSYLHYKFLFLGINVYFLPEKLRKFNDRFGNEYRLKFPNTGILSIIYTLEIIKPKILWLFGLDFYARDYYVEQLKNPDIRPGSVRNEKMKKLDMVNYVCELFAEYPETKIMLGTYYEDWPYVENIEFIE